MKLLIFLAQAKIPADSEVRSSSPVPETSPPKSSTMPPLLQSLFAQAANSKSTPLHATESSNLPSNVSVLDDPLATKEVTSDATEVKLPEVKLVETNVPVIVKASNEILSVPNNEEQNVESTLVSRIDRQITYQFEVMVQKYLKLTKGFDLIILL